MTAMRSRKKIYCFLLVVALCIAVFFTHRNQGGVIETSATVGSAYSSLLFNPSLVHTIDIEMEDWQGFLDTCTDETYVECNLTIDGETYQKVAIRAKGNTSLTQVESYGNDRYSFKIEFDHYNDACRYHGLDKLSLNNIIQDNTYMKDFLTYQMMGYFGVAAPLCSFVYITVDGQDWGLYLAVEGVEDAFLARNYGSSPGMLYKPDSMKMGGGKGFGGEFRMSGWNPQDSGQKDSADADGGPSKPGEEMPQLPGKDGEMPQPPADFDPSKMLPQNKDPGEKDPANGSESRDAGSGERPGSQENKNDGPGERHGGPGAMGADDVTLVYSDDDHESYENIFNNVKTAITDIDKDRLIAALKNLNEGTALTETVDIERVIRYFVVHNFVCNFDSYTGSMIHNYYLYEENGQLSMIPWDYNLAFGGFEGSMDADTLVNYPIDTPVSGDDTQSRPMIAWIFADETYTALYHQYFQEFISSYFDSGLFAQTIDSTKALIAPYVEKDPTKFCTYEEFETGAAVLKDFCLLRAESVNGQLDGSIPATTDGQAADDSTLVDASAISISDMGTMNHGKGGPGRP